jgi:protein-tyrosine phosphatase
MMASESLVVKAPWSFSFSWKMLRNLVAGLVAFLVIGNLVIFAAFQWASRSTAAPYVPPIAGIKNLAAVDHQVWRGSAPSVAGYEGLADHHVKTIVDLRAEDLAVDEELINSLGMNLVRIPLRDGQAPTPDQVDSFLAAVQESPGRVYLHCGAGVGRTGTMAAAYLVSTGQASGLEAVRRNLAVGPPSLEQLAFASSLEQDEVGRVNPLLTVMSRVLDGPRRILVRVRGSYK